MTLALPALLLIALLLYAIYFKGYRSAVRLGNDVEVLRRIGAGR